MDVRRAVVAYEILHKRLKTTVLCRHTLYAHNNDFFIKIYGIKLIADSQMERTFQVSDCFLASLIARFHIYGQSC